MTGKNPAVYAWAESVGAGMSIAPQICRCSQFCRVLSEVAPKVFEESTASTVSPRPELDRLRAACTDGLVDVIVVGSRDRFSYNRAASDRIVAWMLGMNVRVYFLSDQIGSGQNWGPARPALIAL